MPTTRTVAALALFLAAGASHARADQYVFDTSSGGVTLNGFPTTAFAGVAITNGGTGGGMRTWRIAGDMIVPASSTVIFTGSLPARVLIAGNFVNPFTSTVRASGVGLIPGPGGGVGGSAGTGGNVVAGGNGGEGNSVNGGAGQNASGSSFGSPGFTGRDGGRGGAGDSGSGDAGFSGLAPAGGSAAAAGAAGTNGADGGVGMGNMAGAAAGSAGGAPGAPGAGGLSTGSGGAGGSGGTSGGSGNHGGAGSTGLRGGNGGTPPDTLPGANANAYIPVGGSIAHLNGGNGGGGGGGGGCGGAGGGGASGGGGGGGGAGGGQTFTTGGGGGGGGAGGSGGQGGFGGVGGDGGRGGGGGGGLLLAAQGRLELVGGLTNIGGVGGNSTVGFVNGLGANPGIGGNGGQGGNNSGGHGGDGGRGGDGGAGGDGTEGGQGGWGGGGAGGTVFLGATFINATGSVALNGGVSLSTQAPHGRILVSDARTGSPAVPTTVTPILSSNTLDFVPTFPSPYFSGLTTPNIVGSSLGADALDGGPGPFGRLPAAVVIPVGTPPSNAVAAVVRYPVGPAGFDTPLNISNAASTTETFDMFVVVNLTGATQGCAFNGATTGALPGASRAEFGGPGTVVFQDIPASRAWACLGPDSLNLNIPVQLGGVSGILNFPPATSAPIIRYVLAPCTPADVGGQGGTAGPDGLLDNNDFVVFIDAFFNQDPSADVGRQGGIPGTDTHLDNNDFVVFIDFFFTGC